MKLLPILCFMFIALTATASEKPYDEKANARLEIKEARAQAATAHIPVIVVFGANWCPDCMALDMAMKKGASAQLLAQNFKIVKVDIGRRDKNLDIAKDYGVPLQKGIPAMVIVSADNKVLYATHEGELEDARHMGDQGIYDFLKKVTASALVKH